MISRCYFIGVSWAETPVSHQFRALGRALAARGHRVVFLADQQNRAAEEPAGNPAVLTWPSKRPTRAADALFLIKLARRFKPDCLVANFGSVNVMLLAGWSAGVPRRIAWYHTLSSQISDDARVSRLRLGFLRWRKRLVYRFATNLVAVSEGARADLQRVFQTPAGRCRVFYNALADPLQGRTVQKGLSGRNVVACAGRFDHSKGQDVLIRALALPGMEEVRIEFLGEGPERAGCQALAASLGVAGACRFAGAVPHDQVLAVMSQADLTVVPSRDEAFGLVALESLAVGVPVVASAVGGLAEVVRHDQEGWLVPPNDPAALAASIQRALRTPALHAAASRSARARFLDSFVLGPAVEAQANWLESLA